MEFIFMLTHHDVTIPNALQILDEIKDTGVRCVGCKDIGLSFDQYKELFQMLKKGEIESFLEVVTYKDEEHFRAVDLALKIGADNLIGGMPAYTKKTMDYLKQKHSQLRFYPYIGTITGHPCILGGGVREIIRDGKEAEKHGVSGINLLLYRYSENQKELLAATKELQTRLIVAGNVADFEQIKELKRNGIWGFTIGGAVLEGKFVKNGTTKEQIEAVLKSI
jgi:putative N-acetylmannosamine-6-phosphate epimerase